MRVIVAVDPTADPDWVENALRVFPLGDPLDVVLVSALDVPRPPLTAPGPMARRLYAGAVGGLRAEAQRAAQQLVQDLEARLASRAASVTARIVDGRPTPTIIQAARTWAADIILTGPSSRGRVSRALLGSVSDEVVRSAPCPVLVAKRWVSSLQRVLAASDGSQHAEAAVRFLSKLAVPAATEVRVCVVSEASPRSPIPLLCGHGQLRSMLLAVDRQSAQRAMDRARRILADSLRETQSSLRAGDAGHELTDEVNHWVPDLLVIGARGRTAGPGVSLGRVAEVVLRATRCPALVVRS
ncbi:MAG: universal stress protein [Candidatus Methylomirabilales bacterium]